MSLADFLPPLLVAVAAVPFAILVGRARASRLRELHDDIRTSRLRGYLTIFAVIAMIIASSVF